jgi:hypothetical protein
MFTLKNGDEYKTFDKDSELLKWHCTEFINNFKAIYADTGSGTCKIPQNDPPYIDEDDALKKIYKNYPPAKNISEWKLNVALHLYTVITYTNPERKSEQKNFFRVLQKFIKEDSRANQAYVERLQEYQKQEKDQEVSFLKGIGKGKDFLGGLLSGFGSAIAGGASSLAGGIAGGAHSIVEGVSKTAGSMADKITKASSSMTALKGIGKFKGLKRKKKHTHDEEGSDTKNLDKQSNNIDIDDDDFQDEDVKISRKKRTIDQDEDVEEHEKRRTKRGADFEDEDSSEENVVNSKNEANSKEEKVSSSNKKIKTESSKEEEEVHESKRKVTKASELLKKNKKDVSEDLDINEQKGSKKSGEFESKNIDSTLKKEDEKFNRDEERYSNR